MSLFNKLKGEEPLFLRSGFREDRGHRIVRGDPESTGEVGEYLLEYALEHGKVPGRYRVFCNVIVPYRGRTSEIDVLMVHERGIFVFESKNYSGWIFGSADQRQWTSSINKTTKKHFYNPIKQNQSHVKALAAALGLDEGCFQSVIVFSERCALKKVPENTPSVIIIQRQHLVWAVNKILKRREICFEGTQLEGLLSAIVNMVGTPEEKREHAREAEAIKNGELCPWCGSALVRREGRYGAFMGCTAYPKCRYTAKIGR